MYFKQYNKFRYSSNNFYAFTNTDNFYIKNNNIIYLSLCLTLDYAAIRLKQTLEEGIQENFIDGNGGGFYETRVIHDKINSLIYIGFTPDPDSDDDQEYYNYPGEITILEAYQKGILESLHLATENFFYILRTWDRYRKEKPSFLLLYQDDKNWFDLKPFETQELMQEFIAQYIKPE